MCVGGGGGLGGFAEHHLQYSSSTLVHLECAVAWALHVGLAHNVDRLVRVFFVEFHFISFYTAKF